MKITIASVLVDDQAKALSFYADKLGFVEKHDIPLGGARWLTVVSPEDPQGPELLLEPDGNPALGGGAKAFKALFKEKGIPWTMFRVDDVRQEHERLTKLGVRFVTGPTAAGPAVIAVLDDTCGNLIQIFQVEE